MKKQLFFPALFLSLALITVSSASAQQTDTTAFTKPAAQGDDDKIFEKAEVEASVDAALWRKHLQNQLMPVILNAANAGIKPGKYVVNIRFIVGLDGEVSDVRALNDFGYGLAQGAVKVVKTGPRWKPAEQNGRRVRSYHTQPITFVISEK
jgi:protein TonB